VGQYRARRAICHQCHPPSLEKVEGEAEVFGP
jgi:hypothetical protein